MASKQTPSNINVGVATTQTQPTSTSLWAKAKGMVSKAYSGADKYAFGGWLPGGSKIGELWKENYEQLDENIFGGRLPGGYKKPLSEIQADREYEIAKGLIEPDKWWRLDDHKDDVAQNYVQDILREQVASEYIEKLGGEPGAGGYGNYGGEATPGFFDNLATSGKYIVPAILGIGALYLFTKK